MSLLADRRVPLGTWVFPGSNENRDDVFAALARQGVVLLGESHNKVEHHRWQLDKIAAPFNRRPDMILGFEMFPQRVQPVLDRWSEDEVNEVTFLREVEPRDRAA
jgi:uncharacterized iron-regulated protein